MCSLYVRGTLYSHCKGYCLLLVQYCVPQTKRTCIKGLDRTSLFMWKWITSKGTKQLSSLVIPWGLWGSTFFYLRRRKMKKRRILIHKHKFMSHNINVVFQYSVKIKRKCQAVQMNLIFIQRCDISQSPRVGVFGRALVFFWGYSLSTSIDYGVSLQYHQVMLGKCHTVRRKLVK